MASSSEPKNDPRNPRRRAAVACLNCRKRKVRCDVARFGSPCSNCRMDEEECFVLSRRRRRHLPSCDDNGNCYNSAESNIASDFSNSTSSPEDPLYAIIAQTSDGGEDCTMTPRAEDALLGQVDLDQAGLDESPNDLNDIDAQATASISEFSMGLQSYKHDVRFTDNLPRIRRDCTDVLYTYHEFLRHNDFSHLPERDFDLLDTQKCLRVPTRVAMDEFVQQYFLYIHPLLPMLDEVDFWTSYRGHGDVSGGISLLLVQAMLFAACNCVSASTTRALGFSSTREARVEFYRRAKMLYDMNAECSSQAITQTALLLSFWTPPGDLRGRKPNTSWLAIAIHEARAEDAHIYHYGYDCKYGKKPPTLWKRIWWCCIIRDRILSLGVRRSPQITSDDFDFDSCEPLAVSDFKGEIENSSTYTMETRTLLAHMLLRIAKLCAILTRLQSLPSWLEAPRDKDADQLISCMGHVRRVKASLRKWSEETDAEFSSCLQNGKLAGSADTQSKAVAVHLHTMYMYYYSAVTSLLHHEIFLVTMILPQGSPYEILRSGYTSALFTELSDSTRIFAECLDSLLKADLVSMLPISTVALLAIPLVHHILGLHLNNDNSDVAIAKRSNRLNSLIKVIRIFHAQYDGVEWLSSVLKKALQPDKSVNTDEDRARERRWEMEQKPLSYLKMTFTVDFSLSKSRFAEESDTPAYLEELVSGMAMSEDTHATCTEFAGTDQLDVVPSSMHTSLEADMGEFLSVGEGADIVERIMQPSVADDNAPETVYSETLAEDVARSLGTGYDVDAFIDEADFVTFEIKSADAEVV